jgi:hypothetical protein
MGEVLEYMDFRGLHKGDTLTIKAQRANGGKARNLKMLINQPMRMSMPGHTKFTIKGVLEDNKEGTLSVYKSKNKPDKFQLYVKSNAGLIRSVQGFLVSEVRVQRA